jgi:sulfur carrier protein
MSAVTVPVIVNGQPVEVAAGTTVEGLLLQLGQPPEGVAVAIQMQVVPRGERARRPLEPGDRVEVLRAVGGG